MNAEVFVDANIPYYANTRSSDSRHANARKIVAAAQRSGAAALWSEVLSEGQHYGDLVVANPLKTETSPGNN